MLLSVQTLQTLITLYSITYAINITALLYILCIVLDDCNHGFTLHIFSTDLQLHISFIIIIAALCGLPPFITFWPKLYLLVLIGKFGSFFGILLTTLIALFSLLFYIALLNYNNPVITQSFDYYVVSARQLRILLWFIIFLTFGTLFIIDIHLFIYTIFI